MRKILNKHTPAAFQSHTMRILAHLVSLCGCDFTRGLPSCNSNVAMKNVAILWPGLCAAASIDAMDGIFMDSRVIAERFVGVLWKEIQFKKFCGNMRNASFEKLYAELSTNPSISQFRRERLITPLHLHCLVRTGNWVASYWSDSERTPCSLTGGDFGFVRRREGGAIEFDDKVALPQPS